jgi:hypothetical protein
MVGTASPTWWSAASIALVSYAPSALNRPMVDSIRSIIATPTDASSVELWVRGSTVVVEADAAERGAQRSDALEVEAAWRSESGVLGELRLVGDGAAQVQLHAVLSADDGAVLAACDQRLDVAGACAFQLPMAPPAGLRPMRLRVEVSPVIRGRECIARLRLR